MRNPLTAKDFSSEIAVRMEAPGIYQMAGGILNRLLARTIFPILIILFLTGCTSEKSKKPIFTANIDFVENGIKKIIHFKAITFKGSENTVNNKTYTAFEIEIIDPPMSNKFPTPHHEDSLLRNLGKQIVIDIQNNLVDSAEYHYYFISFIGHDFEEPVTLKRYYSYEIGNLDEINPEVKLYQ